MNKSVKAAPVHRLALRVREVGQLFNSMDPTPFLNKDLDPEAEAFIETWASGYVAGSRFHITIHLEQWPPDGDPTEMLTGAIHNHFNYKAGRTRSAFKRLLREGRTSLVIGLIFVSLCLVAADVIGRSGFAGNSIARESLTHCWLGRHVAPAADISIRLVAAATADSPLPDARQCAYPGDSGQMRAEWPIQDIITPSVFGALQAHVT